jgi:hypothetical protein
MARISSENLAYCSERQKCLDCYSLDEDEPSVTFQTRGKFKVPCCKAHFFAHRKKIKEANAKKYDQRTSAKRKAGECTYTKCGHKLIPKELLPKWWKRESRCGLHGIFKAFRVNRAGLASFVIQHCLSPSLGEGMEAQSIIYHAGKGLILFGLSNGKSYLTRGFVAKDLIKRYAEFRRQNLQPLFVKIPRLQTPDR